MVREILRLVQLISKYLLSVYAVLSAVVIQKYKVCCLPPDRVESSNKRLVQELELDKVMNNSL